MIGKRFNTLVQQKSVTSIVNHSRLRTTVTCQAKLKPYKVQEMVFSCLRSKVAYEDLDRIKDVFKKNGSREIFSCKLMSCNMEIRQKIEKVVDDIIADMHNQPIFYDGSSNKTKKRDSQGFVIWKKNTIYVSFRGTKDVGDIVDVIDIRPKRLLRDIIVHTGFAEQFFSIEHVISDDIRKIIKEYPIERIVFTGHSMGGAIACIAAAYYSNMFKNIHITCHTFGSPPTGNAAFVKWFNNGVDESTRLEIEEDIVPLIPINKDFKHVPGGVKLKKDGDIEHAYEVMFTSYADILSRVIRKDDFQEVSANHSCERYIERLLAIKYVRNPHQDDGSNLIV